MRRWMTLAAAVALAVGIAPSADASPLALPNAATLSTEAPRAMPVATKVGQHGNRLTVTPTKGLSSYAQKVKITGKGFSETVGIYVGLCVTPRPGAQPTPCGGGVDQSGSSGASAWISSNPPPYGRNLAIPYKRGGRFTVTISISPIIGSYDCRIVSCSIVSRADHTRTYDRSWDVVVPVTFR